MGLPIGLEASGLQYFQTLITKSLVTNLTFCRLTHYSRNHQKSIARSESLHWKICDRVSIKELEKLQNLHLSAGGRTG